MPERRQTPIELAADVERRQVSTPEQLALEEEELRRRLADDFVRGQGLEPDVARRAASRRVSEEFGAVTPPTSPSVLDAVSRAASPRVTGRDPRTATDRVADLARTFTVDALPGSEMLIRAAAPEPVAEALVGEEGEGEERRQTNEFALALDAFSVLDAVGSVSPGRVSSEIGLAVAEGAGLVDRTELPGAESVREQARSRFASGLQQKLPEARQSQLPVGELLQIQQRQQFANDLASSDEPTTVDAAGIPLESPQAAAVRFLGTLLSSGIQEGAYSIPVLSLRRDGKAVGGTEAGRTLVERLTRGEDASTVLQEELGRLDLGVVRLEEALLGTSPEQRGLYSEAMLSDRSPIVKPILRALQKTEYGWGLGEDFESAAKDQFPDAEAAHQAAFVAGSLVDILTPWEVALKPLGAAAKGQRVLKALPKDLRTVQNLASAVRGDVVRIGESVSEMVADQLRTGASRRDILNVMPDEVRDVVIRMAEDAGVDLRVVDDIELPEPELPPFRVPDEMFLLDDPPGPISPAEAADVAARRAQLAQRLAAESEANLQSIPRQVRNQASQSLDETEGLARQSLRGAQLRRSGAVQRVMDQLGEAPPRNMEEWRRNFRQLETARQNQLIQDTGEVAGYGRQRHEAGQLLRGLDPDQSVQTPAYRLIDADGRVVTQGPLRRAALSMLQRQDADDVIEFGNQRRVAAWSRATRSGRDQGSRLTVDHDFSLPEEAALLEPLQQSKRASIEQVLDTTVRAQSEGRRAGNALTRAFFGAPPGRAPQTPLSPTDEDFVMFVREAFKGRVRSNLGTDLRRIAGNIYVSAREERGIRRAVEAAQRETGFDPSKLSVGAENVIEFGTDAQADAAAKYFARFGVAMPAEPTAQQLRRMNATVVSELAGRSADARYAIAGTGPLSQRMVASLMGRTSQDRLLSRQRWRNATLSTLVPGGNMARLPKPVRDVMTEAQREMESVGAVVLDDIETAVRNGATADEALSATFNRYRPIPPNEQALVASLQEQPAVSDVDIYIARSAILDQVKGREFPDLFSDDPVRIKQGIAKYVDTRQRQMTEHGRRVLKAMIDDPLAETMVANHPTLNGEQLQRVWQGFTRDGYRSQTVQDALREVTASRPQTAIFDERDAMANLVLRYKLDEVMEDVQNRLLEADIGTANPDVRAAMDYLMRTPPLNGSRGNHPHTEGHLQLAKNILRRLGLEKDAIVDLETFGDVALPAAMVQDLTSAAQRGIRVRRNTLTGDAFDWYYGLYKDLLTTFNPAFVVGNAVGIPFMAAQRMGLGRTASAFAQGLERPDMVWELTRRLTPGPFGRLPTASAEVFRTDTGDIYSAAELEQLLRRFQGAQAFQRQVTARQLAAEMDRLSGEWRLFNRFQVGQPGAAGIAGAQMVRDAVAAAGEVPERAFRISAFLRELKRGASPEAAAQTARESLFDYSNLTEFDRNMARYGLVFWSFHRKNLDAFLRALADNPERLGQQFRFARDQRKLWGSRSEEQLSQQTDEDLARVGVKVDGPLGPVWLSTTGVLTPVEGLKFARDLGNIMTFGMTGDAGESLRTLGGQLQPLIRAPAELAFNVDLRTGFRTDSRRANIIPPMLVETPGVNLPMRWMFDPMHVPLRPEQARMAAGFEADGTPYAWAPAPGREQAWRLVSGISGTGRLAQQTLPAAWQGVRALGNSTSYREQANPDTTRAIDVLTALGLRARRELSDQEQRTRLMTERAREFEEMAPPR